VIYERKHDWVMIPQYHHSLLSGDISKNWGMDDLKEDNRWDDVTLAIAQHDCAWIDLDETPFWNDRAKSPYSFIDFPINLRMTFYTKGIDQLERQSPYAGLLCSMHFHSFFVESKELAAIEFAKQEKARQSRLIEQLNLFESGSKELLHLHFLLIQFCDNLSLYLCLQEPGTPKTEEFPWFKNGFPELFPFANGRKIMAEWLDSKRVSLHPFPLASPTVVSVRIKEVSKVNIQQYGIAKAYKDTNWTERTFTLI